MLAAFAVRLHAAGLSLRETAAIFGYLGVQRSHGVVWRWMNRPSDSVADPPRRSRRRVTVDETAVQTNGKRS